MQLGHQPNIALFEMPSIRSPTGTNRRESLSSLYQTQTRHDFQAQGPSKHVERLEAAREEGDYGVALTVCHLMKMHVGGFTANRTYASDALPRPCSEGK